MDGLQTTRELAFVELLRLPLSMFKTSARCPPMPFLPKMCNDSIAVAWSP